LPQGLDISVFLGAVVFAGAGGLLNLCISLWYRDKQAGMGKYLGRITNPITGKLEAVSASGYAFKINRKNLQNWQRWLLYLKIDQGIIFWFLGLITLFLLSLNAYAVLVPRGLVPEGLNIAVVQANIFGDKLGLFGYRLFLLMTFLMLFSVMWTVIDAFARIVSDIIYVNSRLGPFRRVFSRAKNLPISYLYYGLVIGLVVVSALLLPFRQPFTFLVISSVLGGLVMAVYTPLIFFISNFRLPKELKPGLITNIFLIFGSLFYIFFSIWLIWEKIIVCF